MSAAIVARATRLSVVALWREAGLLAATLGLLMVAFTAIQEPRFFRTSEHQLTWPAVFCSADILSLLACCSSLPTANLSFSLRLVRGLACLVAASGLLLLLVTAACVADAATATPTPWVWLPAMILRFVLVWMPIVLLAQLPVGGGGATRLALLTSAFLVQCGVHRASLTGGTEVHQVLSSALATAGGLLALQGGRRY